MSTWGLDGEDYSSLSWSPFEEIVWTEFGGSSDHILPEPKALAQAKLTSSDHLCKRLNHESSHGLTKLPGQTQQKQLNIIPSVQDAQEADFAENLTGTTGTPFITAPGSSDGEVLNSFCSANFPSVSEAQTSATKSSVWLFPRLNNEDGEGIEGSKGVKLAPSNFDFEGLCTYGTINQASDANIKHSSCLVSSSDICLPEGDLDLFGVDHEDSKQGSLLEYGWGNNSDLEDMDELFQNSKSLFTQTTDGMGGMLWSSLSPGTGSSTSGSNYQQIITSSSPNPKEPKGNCEVCKIKMEFVPFDKPMLLPSQDIESDAGSREHNTNNYVKELVDSSVEDTQENLTAELIQRSQKGEPHHKAEKSQQPAKSDKEEKEASSQKSDKIHNAKKVVAGLRQLQKKSKREPLERKLAPISLNFPQTSKHHMQNMPVRVQPTIATLQAFPSPSTNISQGKQNILGELQCLPKCPQAVPYIHAGFGFSSHHMPAVTQSSSLRPQQLHQSQRSYQPFGDDANHQETSRLSIEMPMQPHGSSDTLSSEEKMNRLCWQQKMQSRLALEHQQKQSISQHLSIEENYIQKQQPNQLQAQFVRENLQEVEEEQARVVVTPPLPQAFGTCSMEKNELTVVEQNDSLEATVLLELQSQMFELDVRTRLCIRDALHRLARNAKKRRTIGDSRGSDVNSIQPLYGLVGSKNPSNDDPTSSDRLLAVNVLETETNPIDRSIVHLLFHKYHPLPDSLYMSPSPPKVDTPATSTTVLMHSWQARGMPPSKWVNDLSTVETTTTPEVSHGLEDINAPGGPHALQILHS